MGPPLPRSQTTGDLACFSGAVANTFSASKTCTHSIGTVSQVGVLDALAESRMTDMEIEHFNRVVKEVKTNRRKMRSPNRSTIVSSSDAGMSLASSRALNSPTTFTTSSDMAADQYGDMLDGDSSKRRPFQGARLKVMPGSRSSISPTALTPDSGVSMGSAFKEGWEINVKLVSKPMQIRRAHCPELNF